MNLIPILLRNRRFDGFSKTRPAHSPIADSRTIAIARAAAIEVLG